MFQHDYSVQNIMSHLLEFVCARLCVRLLHRLVCVCMRRLSNLSPLFGPRARVSCQNHLVCVSNRRQQG